MEIKLDNIYDCYELVVESCVYGNHEGFRSKVNYVQRLDDYMFKFHKTLSFYSMHAICLIKCLIEVIFVKMRKFINFNYH